MDRKGKVYNLHKSGLSFKQIGEKLGISKTASYEHVKDEKLIRENSSLNAVPNVSELQKNDCSERPNVIKITNLKSKFPKFR